jgi:hypothetical protein
MNVTQFPHIAAQNNHSMQVLDVASCLELGYRLKQWMCRSKPIWGTHIECWSKMECWTPGAVMVPQLPQRLAENDHSEHVFDVGQLFGAVLSFGTVDMSKRVRFGLKIGF